MGNALDKYHAELLSVWGDSDPDDELLQYWPLLSSAPQVSKVEIITLGLNPSFVEGDLKKHWTAAQQNYPDLALLKLESLKWTQHSTQESFDRMRGAVSRLDAWSRKNYPGYYKPIEDLVNSAREGVAWYHMDLFPFRETQAKRLMGRIPTPRGAEEAAQFNASEPGSKMRKLYEWDKNTQRLFKAAIGLIGDLQPKVVVVLNSHVARILEHRLPLREQANGHRYDCDSLPGIQFLLGSQLSGGATSTYGRKRLLADLRDLLRGKNGLDGGAIPAYSPT